VTDTGKVGSRRSTTPVAVDAGLRRDPTPPAPKGEEDGGWMDKVEGGSIWGVHLRSDVPKFVHEYLLNHTSDM
jgi:hypothetical protein